MTTAGGINIGLTNRAATTGGQQVWTDAWQVEAKPYVTSYTDGSLGTGFRGSKNLLPSAAASFEDGSTGRVGGPGR